jgi:hypothetical protein
VVIGLLLLAGCNGRGNFMVRVTFPDDAARDRTKSLRVVVVAPADHAGCDALKTGTVIPGDSGYVIENQVSFFLPAAGDGEPLGDVGAGRRLFYADAEDESGEVFLRGCAEVKVGERESHLVIIALERAIRPCAGDPDCDDANDCTADRCEDSECVNEAVLDGTDCGVCAACDGLGSCIRDLTQDEDCPVCQECAAAGSCANQAASTACDDGDSCSSSDACDGAGACASGATDRDADGDGYYDQACPGGDDCDDGAILINPGAVEGPDGDPTCSDGVDNDCDGLTDDCSAPDGGHVENPNGYDITFSASDGATQLDHEVEEYDPASGTLVAWVRIPVLSASVDTVIYVYYGYSGVTSPTENPTAVWDNHYVGVWHLKEDAVGTGAANLYTDSTANANHGDDFVSATGQAGQISGGQAFDGVDDYIDCGNDSSLDVEYLTAEFWLDVNSWINDGGILAKGDNSYRQYWVWT